MCPDPSNPAQIVFVASSKTQPVRHESLAGVEYLVAPVVAIVAGVLNGELVPAEEISHFVDAWNGIPLPLGHPVADGNYISANKPEIVAKCPGRFWHAEFRDNRLQGEIWIDIAQANELGGDALEALKRLEAGTPIEVSTGYFRDFDPEPGMFNGKNYFGISRNIRPDHLALLLDEIGACSWHDGCGTPRVNQQTTNVVATNGGQMTKTIVVQMELTLSETQMRIYEAFSAEFPAPEVPPTPYIMDIFEGYVICRHPEKDVCMMTYEIGEDGAVKFGEMQQVERVYRPVGNAEQRATLISGLAANAHCPLGEEDMGRISQDGLEQLRAAVERCGQQPEPETPQTPAGNAEADDARSEDAGTSSAENSETGQSDESAGSGNTEEDAATTDQPEEPAQPEQPDPEWEGLQQLAEAMGGPEAVRQAATNWRQREEREHADLVSELAANQRCAFQEQDLRAMSTEALRKLRASLTPDDYSGRGLPRPQTSGKLIEAPMPD